MEFCCPNPDTPAIIPNPESLKHRRFLRYAMYGAIFSCFAKMILYGPIQGIFQIFSVWILYSCWASMHFCNLIFFMITCGLDLLIIVLSFEKLNYVFG